MSHRTIPIIDSSIVAHERLTLCLPASQESFGQMYQYPIRDIGYKGK